jgi:predicted DNA-binding transcriptional regulator YafY
VVDGTRADQRLERLLHVLPAASREEGASLAVLAEELGTTPARILEDLREATTRVYYHPGGWIEDVQVEIESERIRVRRARGLDRPVRLNARELLCLALALRGGDAAVRLRDDEARRALLRRAEAHLAAGAGREARAEPLRVRVMRERAAERAADGGERAGSAGAGPTEDGRAGDGRTRDATTASSTAPTAPTDPDGPGEPGRAADPGEPGHHAPSPPIDAPGRAPDPEEIRETVVASARSRAPCAIRYLKEGAREAEERLLHPYRVAYADGAWYAVGWCVGSEGMRVFRVDRILEAEPAEGSFEIPDDFDPEAFFDGGVVYHADEEREVRVRYAPAVARWIRERAAWRDIQVEEDGEDGVVVRHRVADPRWIVSHALRYGPDAEILEPPQVRALVREVVREVVEGMGG